MLRKRKTLSPGQRSQTARSYRVFTRDFDVIIAARDLDTVLGPLKARDADALNEAWSVFRGALLGWRTRMDVQALDAAGRLRGVMGQGALSDTVVSILIDQSGSMRGQKMLLAAAAVDGAQDFLRQLGCAVEVLGFTTRSWKGGRARRRWKWRLRPKHPGRLADLLHVIYRSADDGRAVAGEHSLKSMLRPDLPKENIDGEALEWAAGRLRNCPVKRKLLLVVSDGAPVDDSTLSENDPEILDLHLRQVIGEIESAGDIELAAIGIGFDVSLYYADTITLHAPEDLGSIMLALLERILSKKKPEA